MVMPMPVQLQCLRVSHNLLQTLPSWLTELPSLNTVDASHNRLSQLPARWSLLSLANSHQNLL